ncbi:MAG: methyl-accepting chemotaxis protein, partial [Chrysiogenales bacterium]
MNTNQGFRKLLVTHFIITVICEAGAIAVTVILAERAKEKVVWLSAIGILIIYTIIMCGINLFLASGFRKALGTHEARFPEGDASAKKMQSYTKKLYISSMILFGIAPAFYVGIQSLMGIPASLGSIAIGNICLIGIGVIAGNLFHIYLYPVIIDALKRRSYPYRRMKLKHKIVIPIMNLLLSLLVILSLYSYKTALGMFRPATLNQTLAETSLRIDRLLNEHDSVPEADWTKFIAEKIITNDIVSKDFYFILERSGVIIDSSFKDRIGSNAHTDVEKSWRQTDYFAETVQKLLAGEEGICDILYERQVYYAIYLPLPGTDLFLMTGRLSSNFFAPTNRFAVILVLIGIFFVIGITAFSLYTATKKFRTLDEVSVFLKNLSQGDMTSTRMPGGHEIGDEISDMVKATENLAYIFKNISLSLKGAAGDLSDIAGTVSTTIRVISDDSRVQASTIEEFSASVEEITSSIELISENVKTQHEKTQDVFEVIRRFTESMQNISARTIEAEDAAELAYTHVTEIE